MNTKKWSDCYKEIKPTCDDCLKQGIGSNKYIFCSTEKEPKQFLYVTFKIKDENGKDKYVQELVGTLERIYKCNVYHYTIYQGKRAK